MNEIIDLSIIHLIAAYLFILLVLAMMRNRNIGHELELLIATFRMTIQLVLVGYVLDYIFGTENLWLTLLVLIVMEIFAVKNIFKRVKHPMSPAFRKVIAISMFSGTLIS